MSGLGQQFIGNPYLGEFGQQLKRGRLSTGSGKLDQVTKKLTGSRKEKRQIFPMS